MMQNDNTLHLQYWGIWGDLGLNPLFPVRRTLIRKKPHSISSSYFSLLQEKPCRKWNVVAWFCLAVLFECIRDMLFWTGSAKWKRGGCKAWEKHILVTDPFMNSCYTMCTGVEIFYLVTNRGTPEVNLNQSAEASNLPNSSFLFC